MAAQIKIQLLADGSKFSKELQGAEKDISSFDKVLGGFGDTAGKALTAVAAGVAVAGAAAGAALSWGIAEAIDLTATNNKLSAQLGLTAVESERIGKVSASVYEKAWGESMAEVNEAVRSVGTVFGDVSKMSSKEIEKLTTDVMAISETFDLSAEEISQAAGLLFKQGLVGSAQEATDLIAATLQGLPPAMVGPIMDAAHEYGPFFKQLGFSGEQAMLLLKNSAGMGEYALDKTGDALKELTIRGTDMSKASVTAYGLAGLSATDMAKALTAGGEDGADAIKQIADGLLGIKDPVEQANAAIGLFGTPLEDIGTDKIPEFLKSLSGASAGMGDVEGAAKRMADTVSNDPGNAFEGFKRQVKDRFVKFVAENVIPKIMEVVGWLKDHLPAAIDKVRDVWGKLSTIFQEQVLPVIRDQILPKVKELGDYFIDKLVPNIVGLGESAIGASEYLLPLVAALGTLIAGMKVVAMIEQMKTALAAAKVAMAAFNTTLLANPIIIVVAVIAALIAAAYLAYKNIDGFREIVDRLWAVIKEKAIVVFEKLADLWTNTVLPALKEFGNWFVENLLPILIEVGNILGGVFMGAVTAVSWVFSNVLAPILQALWWIITNAILPAIGMFINAFVQVGIAVGNAAVWVGTKIGEIVGWIAGLPGRISGFISGLWDGLKNGITTAKDWIGDKLSDIVGFFSGMPGRISSAASGMWDGLKDAFRSAVNWLIRKWNNFSLTLGGGSVLGMDIPKVTLDTPNIPELAQGGIAKARPGGHVVRVAEAGQDEVIAPLDKLAGMLGLDGSGSSGAPVIHITAQTNASAADIGREVAWALKTR